MHRTSRLQIRRSIAAAGSVQHVLGVLGEFGPEVLPDTQWHCAKTSGKAAGHKDDVHKSHQHTSREWNYKTTLFRMKFIECHCCFNRSHIKYNDASCFCFVYCCIT